MKFAIEIAARGIDFPNFRRVFYSEEFNQEVAEAVKLKERVQVDFQTLPDGKEQRRVHVVPRVQLPGPVQKILNGQQLSYDEVTTFNPATRTTDFRVEGMMGDKVGVSGVIRFVEEANTVKLFFDGEVKANIFGVGGIVERFVASEVKDRYDHVQRLLQQFIDSGRVAKTTPLSQRPPS